MKSEFSSWLIGGTSAFVVVALLGALVLHFGIRLSWNDVAIPVILFTSVQIAYFAAMYRVRTHKSLRFAFAVLGSDLLISGLMMIHYGSRWGLLKGLGDSDLWGFSACIALITLFGMAVAPLLGKRGLEDRLGGIRCDRCKHYHEGHDCTCGCSTEQFKYPPFAGP